MDEDDDDDEDDDGDASKAAQFYLQFSADDNNKWRSLAGPPLFGYTRSVKMNITCILSA